MGIDKARNIDLADGELDQLILSEYPYPIAVNYRRLLETQGWEARTRKSIEIFEYGLRAITLGVLSQYLIRDVHEVSDVELDRKLYRKLPEASVGQWVEFFFLALRAYRGQRKRFFMPELYDLYWDTSQEPHQPHKGIRVPFNRLVQTRNDLAHRLVPESEEEWEVLGREALGHLRTILGWFSFLRHYDLIRVVEQHNDEHEYERYTGQEITTHRERLRGRGEELREGWFYLSRQDRSVLRLHPLLVFFVDGGEAAVGGEKRRDAAVYERLLKEAVEYVATVVRETVKEHDAELIAQFRELIYYNLEHIKLARKRTVLSWTGLHQAAAELSAAEMGTIREKYQRELYLQRDEIFRKFQKFLASNKSCFVLTGKSGVGKSNFVLSLVDEYAEREDVCLLMYNGARLNITETMVRTISEDLARYLTLEGEAAENLFAELDRQGEMAGKILIVVFDAINENVDGKALLRQIDQMVGQERYPWLKVMITSRPQAWRTLKRGLRLAEERYYRERGSDEYWVELQEFTVNLEPFEREELPEVYEKYRQAYRLQTEYEALRPALWSALRDPLILRLVAEVYRDQAIPERIRTSAIYDQYVQTLLRTERLYEEDIILLERELMPLMITEGHYDNKLTASQIHTAQTRDGRPLWELIRSDDLLSSGRRVNDSYLRLMDSEILIEQGPLTDYEIAFKYERFYDHYGGKRLLEMLDENREEKEVAYRNLIVTTREYPFLWGSVKTTLMAEFARGNANLIVDLAQTTSQTIKEILVAALIEYGRDDLKATKAVLASLMLVGNLNDKGLFRSLWARIKRHHYEPPAPIRMARRVAIEVASALGIGEILQEAACDSSAGMRAVAMQYTYYLWKRDPKAGYTILEGLGNRIHSWWILPDRAVFESCLGISLLMLFNDYRKVERESLQSIWHEIIDKLLLVPRDKRSIIGVISAWLRNILLTATINVIVQIMRRAESELEGKIVFSTEELSLFFKQPRSKTERFRHLIPYIDANARDIQVIADDLIQSARDRDVLTMYLVLMILVAHIFRNRGATLEILDEMLDASLAMKPPGPSIVTVLITLANALFVDDVTDERTFHLYETANSRFYAESRCRGQSDRRTFIWAEYGSYPYFHFRKTSQTDFPMLDEFINSVLQNKDLCLLEQFLNAAASTAIQAGVVSPTVRVLAALLTAEEPVRELTTEYLARVRVYHPDAVDDVLAELEISEVIKQQIHDRTPQESFSFLLANITYFVRDAILLGESQFLLEQTQAWLYTATELTDFRQWLRLLTVEIANIVYGEPLF